MPLSFIPLSFIPLSLYPFIPFPPFPPFSLHLFFIFLPDPHVGKRLHRPMPTYIVRPLYLVSLFPCIHFLLNSHVGKRLCELMPTYHAQTCILYPVSCIPVLAIPQHLIHDQLRITDPAKFIYIQTIDQGNRFELFIQELGIHIKCNGIDQHICRFCLQG